MAKFMIIHEPISGDFGSHSHKRNGRSMKQFADRFACLEKPDSNTGNQNRSQVHVSRPLRSWQG